jgi:putative multiple sugar transport system permease protein
MSDKTATLPGTREHAGFVKTNLREYGMLLSLFAIMLFFELVTDGTLLRPLNLTNLVLQNSYIVIMALGMLLVIVTGHIDLSVGSVAGFIGAIAAVLMVRYGVPFIPATIAWSTSASRPAPVVPAMASRSSPPVSLRSRMRSWSAWSSISPI